MYKNVFARVVIYSVFILNILHKSCGHNVGEVINYF